MTSHRTLVTLLTGTLAFGAACAGSTTQSPPSPPVPSGNHCLRPNGDTETFDQLLMCPLGSLPRFNTQCSFFINAVTSTGPAFQTVNVSPAFVNVDEGDSARVPITLVSGTQSGTATLQATHQNCRSQPNCQPMRLASINVSPVCP
jgi:hypothetical protein